MINLRYHLISLIAVFLALALGILIGTTVLDEGVVRLLEAERDQLAGHRDRLQEENRQFGGELELWERFGETIVPDLTAGRLNGRAVTLLVQADAEDAFVDEILVALEHAGATIAGRIGFTDKWALRDDPAREQLALVIGSPQADAAQLLTASAEQLAARLKSPGDAGEQTDLLRSLERNGFLTLDDLDGDAFPPPNPLAIFVGAVDPASMPPRAGFLVPLLASMQDQVRMVVVEQLSTADPLSVHIRGDDVLADTVSTVDHGDTLLGELSLIVALEEAAAGSLAHHYGVEDGAAAIVPAIQR